MAEFPALSLSAYRTLPESTYGETLAFPVDNAVWAPSTYAHPYNYY